MATQSLAVPQSNPKTPKRASGLTAEVRGLLRMQSNELRARISADVGIGDTQAWIKHPLFTELSSIEDVLARPSATSLFIAGFWLKDEIFESYQILEEEGLVRKEGGLALVEGAVCGRSVKFHIPFEATYTFGKPEVVAKGRLPKFN